MNIEEKLWFWYRTPKAIGLIRILLTLVVFAFNPLGLPLCFMQTFPMLVIMVTLFAYGKLFSDMVPVITLLLPTIVHFAVIVLFMDKIVIAAFLPFILTDVAFLVTKGIKASYFPFAIEGEKDVLSEFQEVESEI